MLQHLVIKNIVLIESLNINFTEGLCVLTGETGAGKSILLDALGLVLGNKASSKLIRSGEKQGTVIASFDIADNDNVKEILHSNDIEEDGEVLLKRVVYDNGKSKAYINDEPVSVKLLQQLSSFLIEIHGQHDQRYLFDAQKHREMFDIFGNHLPLCKEVSLHYNEWRAVKKQYKALYEEAEKAKRDEEYYRHIYDELQQLAPEEGEDVVLADKRQAMLNVSKIFEVIDEISKQISDKTNVLQALYSAEKVLARLPQSVDESLFKPVEQSLERATIEVQEVINSIDVVRDSVGYDKRELQEIEERLFALRDMARKYNIPVSELAKYADEVAHKISTLDGAEEQIAALSKKEKQLKEIYLKSAKELSGLRHTNAEVFANAIEVELKPLKMENCKFRVDLNVLEEEYWNEFGMEHVEFSVKTNPGSPYGPIKSIASGGELSRFMVSLKVTLADKNTIPTMIFDEIDTGIGGATSDAVGRRLAILGKNVQVMCVTHQPQVAGYGNCHLRIEKQLVNEKMQTHVHKINQGEKVEELARMLAGENITSEAREAAKKLINQ